MKSFTFLRSWISVVLIVFLLGMTGDDKFPRVKPAVDTAYSGLPPGSVEASGPEQGKTLEDHVEVSWTVDTPILPTSTFHITRRELPSGTAALIRVAASTASLYDDYAAAPNVTYEYCVAVVNAAGVSDPIGCNTGKRVIVQPTGFTVTQGDYEHQVLLSWDDNSQIEGGFNVYRDAGRALRFDGTNDYVVMPGTVALDNSFSFEFWAKRTSTNTDDFVVGVESNPNGDPVNTDLEVGFSAAGKFQFRFGTNILSTPLSYTDTAWHHWAVAYDAPGRRRIIYRDGVRVATDVLSSTYRPSGKLEFGRRESQGNSNNKGHYHGLLDEVRFWRKALTQDEVASGMLKLFSGLEAGLESYWPMDVATGLNAPDVTGDLSGALTSMTANDWVPTGVAEFYRRVGANLTLYSDQTAVAGYQSYHYRLAAYEDINADGVYTAGTDFESQILTADGWRALLTPPANVQATDGQYNDRVVITWVDRSQFETNYRVYRGATLIATVAADAEEYTDLSAAGQQNYCVAAFGGGSESNKTCDQGMAGGLAAPSNVMATEDVYDDRVSITWTDVSNTEEGFELYRAIAPFVIPNGALVATLGADATEYNDVTAAQGVQYYYCLRAFSKADPLNPAYSTQSCTATPGRRANVLMPTSLSASVDKFEDRVDLSWTSNATTVMLFMMYRDDALIEVLDFSRASTMDFDIDSDVDYNYCVSAGTVTASNAVAMQGRVAQMLENISMQDQVAMKSGGTPSTLEDRLVAVRTAIGLDMGSASNVLSIDGFVESDTTCATGSRSIKMPTTVAATDNEFESHVQLNWTDNSSIEAGYYIYRSGTTLPVATLSANRTTYGDYTGAPGSIFTYTVEAFDGRDSRSQTGSDAGQRTLDPPTVVVASKGTSESLIDLTWKDNSGAESGYRIYRRLDQTADPFVAIGATGNNEPAFSDHITNASDLGRHFEYKVVAFDGYGESIGDLTTGWTMLESPANVNASDVYDDKVVLVWVDRSKVELGYEVTRRLYGATTATPTVLASLGANITTLTDTPGDTEAYQYCVRATLSGNIKSDPVCDVGKKYSDGGSTTAAGVQPFKIVSPIKLGTSWDAERGIRFGASVAMSGDNAIIGVPGADPGTTIQRQSDGIVFPWKVVAATNTWNKARGPWGYDGNFGFFRPPYDGDCCNYNVNGLEFGAAVDISGNYVIIGDPYFDDDKAGRYQVYELNGNGDWDLRISTGSGHATKDNTGYSVALTNEYAIVGNPQFVEGGLTDHGEATICNVANRANNGNCVGTIPRLQEKLLTSEKLAGAAFGHSVDILREGDILTAIVGAPGNEAAYIFDCNIAASTVADPFKAGCSLTTDWTKRAVLDSRFAAGSLYGASVAINGQMVVIGAPGAKGIAVYTRAGTTLTETPVTTRSKAAEFGAVVTLNANTIVVGAPGEVISGIPDAGAIYVFDFNATSGVTTETFRYDARAGGQVLDGARFGSSIAFDGAYYLVGSPGDDGFVIDTETGEADSSGAAYSIPLNFEPPTTAVIPRDVALLTPTGIKASDGTSSDRIQIRWKDESDDEDGHVIYRSNETGGFDRLADVGPNVQFFDDSKAAPGEAYTYCVGAFFNESETELSCDVGWRPPNGTIAGRISERQGSATEGAQVCLVPSPNKALLFDGVGGYIEAIVGDELDLSADFTVEAWIRPHDVTGTATIVSKDKDWSFELIDNKLQFRLFRDQGADAPVLDARPILPGVWTHVAVSFYTENNIPKATFFIGGVGVGPVLTDGFSSIKGDTLTIGNEQDMATYFNGEMDEVRMWSGERTQQQIDSLKSVKLKGKEENLIGYWPLDQGSRRIGPDLSKSANHGHFANGVYLVDEGAGIDVCTFTSKDGNYSIAGIRYGDITEFNVIPSRTGRDFSPSFKKITLAVDSPVQNEVGFIDVTSLAVSGFVRFVDQVGGDTFSCPVPGVVIHTSKSNVASDDNVRIKTGADGSYTTSVDPSSSQSDPWYIIPTLVDQEDASLIHQFTPSSIQRYINEPQSGVDFLDNTRFSLTGFFSGGDPTTCHQNIGTATIRIYTEDGCYNREFEVNSAVANGAFPTLDLPPLHYLMEVTEVDVSGDRAQDIKDFFTALGAVEVDLTRGPLERNLTYRAPIELAIGGLEGDPSCTEITQTADNVVLRTLPNVKVIRELQSVPLDIRVREDYGNGLFCDVNEGTVTIYDAISDNVDQDSTIALVNGTVDYSTVGVSPNIYSGARIQGVDRSFQKPITVVAQVEGRKSLVDSKWAIVEGFRERSATFVSAVTEEFPLLILHDPPGSNSSASIEKGNTMCTRISNTKLSGFGRGVEVDLKIGFKLTAGPSFIVSALGTNGAGIWLATRTVAGLDTGGLNGENIEICLSVNETFETSNDPGWVGEDIFAGVALNLIFALADVLEVNQCAVTLSETLATDLDQAEPFETTYLYGKSHIAQSLIPELENLIRIGGDATIEGDLKGVSTPIRLQSAVENWKNQLILNETLINAGINSGTPDPFDEKNRSFSGGTAFSHSQTVDTSRVTALTTSRIFVNSQNTAGLTGDIFGYDQKIGIAFDQTAEWNYSTESTESSSQTIGYVLSDNDAGDFFTVDVGIDPRYHTKVFSTKSGRSSNPWEANTQKRDNPIIMVDPPVQYDVDPTRSGVVQLTLINGSESNERRRYVIEAPGETNPQNLRMVVAGAPLGGNKEYLLDPGKAITVDMQVLPTTNFSYKNVGVMMYPPDEYNIWIGDTRLPFALSDTAFFSVYFDSTGGNVLTSVLAEGWNWVSINREGASIDSVFARVPISHGDRIRNQYVESRYDSTYGWVGGLSELKPGEGYRVKVQKPGFLRMQGEAVKTTEPLKMASGWNWVGYLPQKRTHLGEALASLDHTVMDGDAIVGQNGFSQYVHGIGWVGTLKDMMPGESYALYLSSGGDLAYPLEPTNANRPVDEPRETTVEGPEWAMSAQEFTTSMTVVAEVKMGSVPLEQTTTKIAVFAGDQIRGTGEVRYVEGLGQYLAFIQIYGEFDEEEDMVVHVYDGEAHSLYEDVATIHYSAQQMIGQPSRPVVLDLSKAGSAPELLDLPEQLALYPNYPNPFNETSTISYDLPEAADVTIVVYDLLGRRVANLVDGEQPAGRHKAIFNAKSLASGVYFYRMYTGDFDEVGKMIVVK